MPPKSGAKKKGVKSKGQAWLPFKVSDEQEERKQKQKQQQQQSQEKAKPKYEENVLVPVTVALLREESAMYMKKSWVSLVAQVRSARVEIHEVILSLDDATGLALPAKAEVELLDIKWEEINKKYMQVVGMLNLGQDDELQLVVHSLLPVTDYNQLIFHVLSVFALHGTNKTKKAITATAALTTEEHKRHESTIVSHLKGNDKDEGWSKSALSEVMTSAGQNPNHLDKILASLEQECTIFETSPGHFRWYPIT